jgi:hypothetical protein
MFSAKTEYTELYVEIHFLTYDFFDLKQWRYGQTNRYQNLKRIDSCPNLLGIDLYGTFKRIDSIRSWNSG